LFSFLYKITLFDLSIKVGEVQDLLDNHELFIDNGLKTAEYISEELDIPFIFMEQAHGWYIPTHMFM